jgi:hypothetical protein
VGRLHRGRRGGHRLPTHEQDLRHDPVPLVRVEDGRIVEHWANRDDLGTAKQLGWVPPTPIYLFKMALAKRRAKRS